jgi:bacteriophage N4 adsorption protein B
VDWTNDIWITEAVFALLAFGNMVSGIDDLVIDFYYWLAYSLRRLRYPRSRYPMLSDEDLDSIPQKKAAIFVAAWHEEDVLEQMLLTNSKLIDYQNYDFFIACYPNDHPTQEKIDSACRQLPNVIKAVNPRPGPSNKADNLNAAFAELVRQEKRTGERYEFIVMHDPEDVLHPLELKLYNYLMTRRKVSMVQTPVFPIEVPAMKFTASCYMDEFAETHTKDIYVREWVRGFVPSAGVGTAIARNVFDRLTEKFGAKVFNTESLTEDYDFSLRLKLSGYKSIFVRQSLIRKKDLWGRPKKELIATRAHFPATFKTAVRQRTRWMVGINFQNWKQVGWQGKMQTRWMLFHDRKGVWSNTVVMMNYLFILYGLCHLLYRTFISPGAGPLLPDRAWIGWAITICLGLMFNRMLQRFIATTRIYGVRQGFLSIPRMLWGNIINITVTVRAAKQFFTAEARGMKIAWDKTQHFFPSQGEILANKRGLGDVIVHTGRVAVATAQAAMAVQPSPDWHLEDALVELRKMVEADITRELAMQSARMVEQRNFAIASARVGPAVEPGEENPQSAPSLSELLVGRRKTNISDLGRIIDGDVAYAFGD